MYPFVKNKISFFSYIFYLLFTKNPSSGKSGPKLAVNDSNVFSVLLFASYLNENFIKKILCYLLLILKKILLKNFFDQIVQSLKKLLIFCSEQSLLVGTCSPKGDLGCLK